jgi:hypothetical protein
MIKIKSCKSKHYKRQKQGECMNGTSEPLKGTVWGVNGHKTKKETTFADSLSCYFCIG